MPQQSPIHIIPLGGVGEMGMNMTLVRIGEAYLMIDCGVQFPDPEDVGVEKRVPNLSFLAEIADRLEGIVLTHGHEDHIGALRWVLKQHPLPVLGTAFTLNLVKKKLAEYGLSASLDCQEIRAGEQIQFGSFDLQFLGVTHSIPGCLSVAIRTPMGHIVLTGDYRIDPTPLDDLPFDSAGFARLADEGVVMLLSDSTNALVPGHTRTETEVAENLDALIRPWEGRIIVTTFSSNLYRLSSLYGIAQRHDRTLCTVGRSLATYLEVGRQTTTLNLPDPDKLPTLSQSANLPRARTMVICTGSQAEPRSALVQAASGKHKSFSIQPDDLVLFSSRVIPGNERRVHRLINSLMRRGATCIYGSTLGIHASGHAKRDELAEMIRLTRPKYFVPIHGEYSFLHAHRELARECGVPHTRMITNGEVLELSPSNLKVVAKVDATPLCDDGATLGTAEDIKLNEKKRMAWHGAVMAYIQPRTTPRDGEKYSAQVESAGIFSDNGLVEEYAAQHLNDGLKTLPLDLPADAVEEQARLLLRRFFRRRYQKKPIIFVRVARP
jgi:ribonuclease J